MMNPREEELFGILQEESAEAIEILSRIIKVVSKRRRFPENIERSSKELHQEIGDFFGVVQLLVQEGHVDLAQVELAVQHKLEKLERNMKHKRPNQNLPAPALKHEELKDHNSHREEDASNEKVS